MLEDETRVVGGPVEQPRLAPAEEAPPKKMPGGWLRDLVETLLLTVVIFFGIRAIVQSYKVEMNSMQPNLVPGERLFVNKAVHWRVEEDSPLAFLAQGDDPGYDERYIFHPPERGDVIVFHSPRNPEMDLIKRVIGLPGDTIQFREGKVYVNGKLLSEPYLDDVPTLWFDVGDDGGDDRVVSVPEDELFVMGDNRTGSNDSRDFGPVPVENVVGTAMFAYWPTSKWGGIPGAVIFLPRQPALSLPTR